MKIVTGQVVRGDNFFKRITLIKKLWRKIDSSSSIIISAPRRVGKTSLMRYIQDHPTENYYVVYVITESVYNENRYYEEIVKAILSSEFVNIKDKSLIKFKDLLGAISIEEIGADSVKFGKKVETEYFYKLIDIIKAINLGDHKLIIMIDEFAQTIQNIQEKEDMFSAVHLLQSNRALRQNSDINKKFQFIYTGSISLEGIARRMDSSKFINDLDILKVPPLNEEEGKEFISELLKNLDFTMDVATIQFMINEIKWLNPIYIQLTLDKICDISEEEKITRIDNIVVKRAITLSIEERNKFESWHERLKIYKGNEYKFIIELLNTMSKVESKNLNTIEIYDLAVRYELESAYKEIINALIDDGYISNIDNEKKYTFTSPILRMWWCKKIAN